MEHAIRCSCGNVCGQLRRAEKSTRLTCYCKDCQAFAHYLGRAGDMLDAQGGSDIVVSHPQHLAFSSGTQALACMSLSETGLLRWYASCCNTPIGNTPRNQKLAFVGLSSACLGSPAEVDGAFGPVRMRSCTESAKGTVAGSGLKAVPVMIGFASALLLARVNGSYAGNPFFTSGSAVPVAMPTVLAKEERERMKAMA